MARRRKDIDAFIREARTLEVEDRAAIVDALLTPELRLRLIAEQMRRYVRVTDREVTRAVSRALRRVRGVTRAPQSGR